MRLLPALPNAWPTGKVSGLRARSGFAVDMDWAQGKLTEAAIVSEAGLPCALRCGTLPLRVSSAGGVSVKTETKEGVVRFETRKGDKYRIRAE